MIFFNVPNEYQTALEKWAPATPIEKSCLAVVSMNSLNETMSSLIKRNIPVVILELNQELYGYNDAHGLPCSYVAAQGLSPSEVARFAIKELMTLWRSTSYACEIKFVDFLIPHYQPILNPISGEIIGHEALARVDLGRKLIHPESILEWITPKENIAIMMATLNGAAKQNYEGKLFVNLDIASVLCHNTFSEFLRFYTDFSIRSPKIKIVIEITEEDFSRHEREIEALDRHLSILRDNSIGIAMDDFGAAGSNYDKLRQIRDHVELVKIDKSEFHTICKTCNKLSAVNRLKQLISTLDTSSVVIEGVENQEQLSICFEVANSSSSQNIFVQGFYLGMPNKTPVRSMEAICAAAR